MVGRTAWSECTTTSRWCSNAAQPDLQTLEKIAQLLEVDKRDLLTPSELK
jgi:transcriptional regulator with XRE-family HTH domain